jgi:hypothetical protein
MLSRILGFSRAATRSRPKPTPTPRTFIRTGEHAFLYHDPFVEFYGEIENLSSPLLATTALYFYCLRKKLGKKHRFVAVLTKADDEVAPDMSSTTPNCNHEDYEQSNESLGVIPPPLQQAATASNSSCQPEFRCVFAGIECRCG